MIKKEVISIIVLVVFSFNLLFSQKLGSILTVTLGDLTEKNEICMYVKIGTEKDIGTYEMVEVEPQYRLEEKRIIVDHYELNEKGEKLVRILYKPKSNLIELIKNVFVEVKGDKIQKEATILKSYESDPEYKLIKLEDMIKIEGTENEYKTNVLIEIESMKINIIHTIVEDKKNWKLVNLKKEAYTFFKEPKFIEFEKALDSLGYEVKINGEIDTIDKKAITAFIRKEGIPVCGLIGVLESMRITMGLKEEEVYVNRISISNKSIMNE